MSRKRNMTREQLLAWIESNSTPCPETGCWLWCGSVTNGYARMGLGGGKSITVSRFILNLSPEDPREACRCCDCPPCVNPRHLYAAAHADNMREMAERGRAARGPRDERTQGPYHPARWSPPKGVALPLLLGAVDALTKHNFGALNS